MEFRPATSADQEQIIALLDSIFGEYGDRVCLEGSEADLTDIPGHYADGQFMVLESGGRVIGTVAVAPCGEDTTACWLKRMYLSPELRGTGAGAKFIDWAKERTRLLGRSRVQCWSDVRFERAHAFYRKMGFVDPGRRRRMEDSFEPYEEFFFWLDCS